MKVFNKEMSRQNRKIVLIMDHAPVHLILKEPIPDMSHIKIVYIAKLMTDKLQPLDCNLIAVLKNKYKRWLNLELFNGEEILSKFTKIKKMVDILYSIRPEIGRYCWDCTIYKGQNELEIPPEIIASHVEAQEEMMQKVTNGLEKLQMYIEEDAESNDEDDYVELMEVPDLENALENVSENASKNVPNGVENFKEKKVQSKITSFFSNKK